MAVILPGPAISDIRGRVGDLVFERNAGGLYVRSKGVVSQVYSDARKAAKDALSYLARRYQADLTVQVRLDWTRYAAAYPDTDRWGRSKVRTGQQAYISFNFHTAVAYGVEYRDEAPTVAPLPKAQIAAHIHLATDLIHVQTPIATWPTPTLNQIYYVYQSVAVNNTRDYAAQTCRFAGAFAPGFAGWAPQIEVPTVFDVVAGKTSWITLYHNDADPIIEARRNIVKATTI